MSNAKTPRAGSPRRATAIPITMTGEPLIVEFTIPSPSHSSAAPKSSPKKASDSVCNSYLKSYENFGKEVRESVGAVGTHLRNSKKGRIMETLAALDKGSATKQLSGLKRR